MFAVSQVLQTWMKCELVAGKMKLKYDSWYKNKPVYKLSLKAKLTMTLSNKKAVKTEEIHNESTSHHKWVIKIVTHQSNTV